LTGQKEFLIGKLILIVEIPHAAHGLNLIIEQSLHWGLILQKINFLIEAGGFGGSRNQIFGVN
jgi:hypothetical protein